MKPNLKELAIAVSLVSLGSIASANAEARGGYIGGGVSAISAEIDSYNTTGTGFEWSGGYQINQWFGFEGKFILTGNLETGSSDVMATSLSITPKFTIPANDNFSLFVKIGMASMGLSFDRFDDDFEDDDYFGMGTTFGMGATFVISKHWSGSFSYDFTTAILDSEDDYDYSDYNVDLSSAAFSVHFRF